MELESMLYLSSVYMGDGSFASPISRIYYYIYYILSELVPLVSVELHSWG